MKNKILFINTEKSTQNILMDLLNMDFECVPLSTSAEGVSYLGECMAPIELILVDLMEAVRDDFSILKEVRGHNLYRDIPILVLAAQTQTTNIAQVFKMGADDIILLPLNQDIAKQRIHNLLDIGNRRKIHNVMEDLIISEIESNIDVLGICSCPQCRRDLLTLTLNHSKPRYVSTEKGQALINAGQRASVNDRIQLLTEITRYANLIKENPRHEK